MDLAVLNALIFLSARVKKYIFHSGPIKNKYLGNSKK